MFNDNHHLKHGNSLIGARVADVQKALEGQQTLFSGNKFAGVMLATDLMRQVSYLSDNTIEQTRRSAQAYRDARDHLAPYKRVLDVYTSRWFGNTPTTNKRETFDPTIEFLKRHDTQAWLEDPHAPENQLPDDDYMKAGQVAKRALQAAEDKHFFHWELEFPEVFFAPRTPGGQDVQLKADGGFDVVVGNPPYANAWSMTDLDSKEREAIATLLDRSDLLSGHWDLYAAFIIRVLTLIRENGLQSFIVPDAFARESYAEQLREHMLTNLTFPRLVHFEGFNVFDEVSRHCIVYIAGKTDPDSATTTTIAAPTGVGTQIEEVGHIAQFEWLESEGIQIRTNLWINRKEAA